MARARLLLFIRKMTIWYGKNDLVRFGTGNV